VLDGVEHLTGNQLVEAVRGVFNFKVVRSLILTTRADPASRRQRVLNLGLLSDVETKLLMESQMSALSPESMLRVLELAKGHPLAYMITPSWPLIGTIRRKYVFNASKWTMVSVLALLFPTDCR
jgi:hypothetical protein